MGSTTSRRLMRPHMLELGDCCLAVTSDMLLRLSLRGSQTFVKSGIFSALKSSDFLNSLAAFSTSFTLASLASLAASSSVQSRIRGVQGRLKVGISLALNCCDCRSSFTAWASSSACFFRLSSSCRVCSSIFSFMASSYFARISARKSVSNIKCFSLVIGETAFVGLKGLYTPDETGRALNLRAASSLRSLSFNSFSFHSMCSPCKVSLRKLKGLNSVVLLTKGLSGIRGVLFMLFGTGRALNAGMGFGSGFSYGSENDRLRLNGCGTVTPLGPVKGGCSGCCCDLPVRAISLLNALIIQDEV
mmetsp:Transcript_17429/g.37933  ORF Transcript_17429/g.37933 Transcript_17429/m.37933 type:complete len:303 (+) Transcript_17429:478-1386(+)